LERTFLLGQEDLDDEQCFALGFMEDYPQNE
jgi:hypothetical protein